MPGKPSHGAGARTAGRLRAGRGDHGFGHRVYKAEHPRASYLRQMPAGVDGASGDSRDRMSRPMEEVVLAEKDRYPNVDFLAAPVRRYPGGPADLCSPVFPVSRSAGWTAHMAALGAR